MARRAHGQLLSAGAADALDTYVVRHLGTLMAFSAMLPAVFAAGIPGAAGEHHPSLPSGAGLVVAAPRRAVLTPPPCVTLYRQLVVRWLVRRGQRCCTTYECECGVTCGTVFAITLRVT